jgi:hypothetical protein
VVLAKGENIARGHEVEPTIVGSWSDDILLLASRESTIFNGFGFLYFSVRAYETN